MTMLRNSTDAGMRQDATRTISVGDASVSFSERGAGEPVMLLHSSAASSAQWHTLSDRLEDGYRILAPDLLGYGRSDAWPGKGMLTMKEEAAPVGALIARCGEPVHLVGHSFGGAVALRAALDFPGRIRSLTLIEPVAFNILHSGDEDDYALLDEVKGLAEAVSIAALTGDTWGGMARFVDYWNGAGAWSRLKTEKRQALSRQLLRIAQNFYSGASENAMPDAYARIAVPTLILRGGRSPAPSRRIAELLAAEISGAHLKTLSDAGHMLPLTHAEIVNTEIAEHLARNTGAWHLAA